MELNLFDKKIKFTTFSVAVFAFFLLVALVSLHIVHEKILENSHIMGREIAARFAIKETYKIKTQEVLLRGAAQNLAQLRKQNPGMGTDEIEKLLYDFAEESKKNNEWNRLEMCAVIDGKFVGTYNESDTVNPQQLQWYRNALANRNSVVYTNLYRSEDRDENVLTMAVNIEGTDDVVAANLYPERLNSLLAVNKLPPKSYYYLCDPQGKIMFNITDRNMTLEAQQPYVDQILNEIRQSTGDVSYITDLEGHKRGVYYTISNTGWMSIVTIPYDYLMGDYKSLLQWFIITLCMFLLLVMLLSLREYLFQKQYNRVEEVIQVMNKSFLAVFRINYKTGRYETLKAANIGFDPHEDGSYETLLKNITEQMESGAVAEFAEKFSPKNIERLIADHIYDFGGEFQQHFGDGYKWVNVRLVHDEEYLRADEAIFFFREVDAEKQKELEHTQLLEHALRVSRENVKSRNMFFSAMSHDMRAPLNGIIGMAELATLHKDDQALVSGYIEKIKASGKQLLTLINDILEMARLDNGKVEHVDETFEMVATIQEVGALFSAQAEMEKKHFEQQILIEEETVSGDVQSLHQILNNILSNALKYTKAGGSISFAVSKDNLASKRSRSVYIFTVKDTGCGMSEKFLKRIFEPFVRDSRFGVPNVVGTGLGMAIVKSLVERLDGTINISSEVDKGTCVIISLPFTVVNQGQKKAKDAMSLKSFAGCRVLVAEDDSINMEIITELLTMNGIEVLQAADGQEAVDKFSSMPAGSIDLILMDMQMPRVDGCEATEKIRALASAHKDAKTVPIVALTGNSADEDIERAMLAGMNDFMTKPVKMNLLAQMLGKYLGAKEGHEE